MEACCATMPLFDVALAIVVRVTFAEKAPPVPAVVWRFLALLPSEFVAL